MADKFRERFKIDCPVPMSIKWKDSSKTGTLGKDSSRMNAPEKDTSKEGTSANVLEKKIVF